jgi:hypothetical protein
MKISKKKTIKMMCIAAAVLFVTLSATTTISARPGHWELHIIDHPCERPSWWDNFWHPNREYWIDGNGQWYWREYYYVWIWDDIDQELNNDDYN